MPVVTEAAVIDQYTFLDYKGQFGSEWLPGRVEFWVGEENMRRLKAYQVYESYYKNNSREWLNSDDEDVRRSRREYGDPYVVVETILSSLLGEDQSIVVDPKSGTAQSRSAYQAKILEWETQERFRVKLAACERKAIKLGDGVYVLGFDDKTRRPKCTVWDPGFYFPVWDEENPEEEFPNKVHIAYDFERDNELGETERFLRRVTWDLVPLLGEEVDEDGDPIPLTRETSGVTDRPWNGEGPTTETVLMTDMTWKYDDIGREDEGAIYHLDLDRVHEIAKDEEDLEIDWIPVIHISNTDTDSGDRFGVSSLAPIMQIVDDLISTDTDLQAASATTGSPPLVVPDPVFNEEDDGSIRSYGPGEIIGTSGDGKGAMLIDTSNALDALIKYDDKLLNRVSVNGRIPDSLLGRVKPSDVPSGITLTLSFAPHTSMIREGRMIRENKYELFFKMVGRFYMQDGQISEVLPAKLHFGTFLPADKQETKELIVALLTAHAISIDTAVRMLIEAGFPIDDVVKEVKAIQAMDFEGAGLLLGITADANDARKYLGMPPVVIDEVPAEEEDPDELNLDDDAPEPPVA